MTVKVHETFLFNIQVPNPMIFLRDLTCAKIRVLWIVENGPVY